MSFRIVMCLVRNKIMNYDIFDGALRLCCTQRDYGSANERQGGAPRRAPSEGLLYMNYDDAATPPAVISL